jgi:class 3 adenylate cyclase
VIAVSVSEKEPPPPRLYLTLHVVLDNFFIASPDVAVSGLPSPNKDHAIVMARFAYECLQETSRLTKELEVTLGPGTSDLALRIGLHSGSLTAGVLRGEKSRFQLFGDTMNTAVSD